VGRIAAVSFGSNLGDRRSHLDFAAHRLATVFDTLDVSSYFETDPVGIPEPQPRYLNAAAVGQTAVPPHELLEALLAIERERGRERPYPNAPRTLDLDLILVGDSVLDEPPRIVLPHPRFRERRFVLEPLAEIAPELRDPVSGLTIAELVDGRRRS
jgi:2-amino-4-hydroxy-6-hydroxymethyldihydropteridine diphosphokinase